MYPKIFGPFAWATLEQLPYNAYKQIQQIEKERLKYPNRFPPKSDDKVDPNILPSYKKLRETDSCSIHDIKLSVLTFIKLFYLFIPCKTCSNDTRKYATENPFPINEPEKWMKWIYNFKKHVNEKTKNITFISYEDFIYRLKYFTLISAENIFKILLIISSNIDYIYPKNELPTLEIKEIYRSYKLFFASLYVLFHFSPSLITAAPFILLSHWEPSDDIDFSLFRAVYQSASTYEKETQSRLFIKYEKGIPSAHVNKKDYIPMIFGSSEKSCFAKYRYQIDKK